MFIITSGKFHLAKLSLPTSRRRLKRMADLFAPRTVRLQLQISIQILELDAKVASPLGQIRRRKIGAR